MLRYVLRLYAHDGGEYVCAYICVPTPYTCFAHATKHIFILMIGFIHHARLNPRRA